MLVHHRRRLARAAVAALVALATLSAAPAAHADHPPGLFLTVTETCGWLLRGDATPMRIDVRNDADGTLHDISLVPRLPAGLTATVTRAPGPVLIGFSASFHVSVAVPAGAAAGPVRLRFDAVAGTLTDSLEVDTHIVGRPAAPTAVTAIAHDGTASVTWQPGPAQPYAGERAQRLYLVTASPGGARASVLGGTAATVAGLTNGTAYTFTVSEWNHFGTTESAPSAPVVPVGVPGLVTGVTVTDGTVTEGGTTRTVSWAAAAPNGAPVEKYTVLAHPGRYVVAVADGTATSAEFTISDDAVETFTVRATNRAGTGPESLRPGGPPAPFDGVLEVAAGEETVAAHLSFDAESPPAVDGWLLTLQPGGHQQYVPRDAAGASPGHAAAEWDAPLPGTTVAVTVRGINAAGAGAPGRAVVRTAAAPAEQPVIAGRVSRDRASDVCFLGAWDRGSPMTGYRFWHLDQPRDVALAARIVPVAFPSNGPAGSIELFGVDRYGSAVGPASEYMELWAAGPPPALIGAQAESYGTAVRIDWEVGDGYRGQTAQIVSSPGGVTAYGLPGRPAWVDDLDPHTTYTFSVRLFDEHGLGPAVVTEPVTTTYGRPDSIQSVRVAAVPGDPRAVLVTWQPPADNGSPITEYTVSYSSTGRVVVPAPATSVTLRDLNYDVTYSISVTAWNAAGPGPGGPGATYRTPPPPGPAVTVTAPPAVTTSAAARLAYAAPDAVSYDVRYRVARYDGGLGAYRYPAGWQATTATDVSVLTRQGWAYCFGVRARDWRGVVSDWTRDTCTAAPVDDVALSAGPGWTRRTSAAYYAGTVTATATAGATLTRTNVRARRLALVSTACGACGDVGVYLDGVLLRRVRLTAGTTAYRRAVMVDLGAVRTGTVTLKVLSGRAYVDGLGVLPV